MGLQAPVNVNVPRKKRPIWQWGVLGIVALVVCSGVASVAGPKKAAQQASTIVLAPTSTAEIATAADTPPLATYTIAGAIAKRTGAVAATAVASRATQAQSTSAPSGAVTITQQPGTAARGSDAHVNVRTEPGATCRISVRYGSGEESTAKGLQQTTANASGVASWTWRIGAKTTSGTWPVTITCGDAEASTTITIR